NCANKGRPSRLSRQSRRYKLVSAVVQSEDRLVLRSDVGEQFDNIHQRRGTAGVSRGPDVFGTIPTARRARRGCVWGRSRDRSEDRRKEMGFPAERSFNRGGKTPHRISTTTPRR